MTSLEGSGFGSAEQRKRRSGGMPPLPVSDRGSPWFAVRSGTQRARRPAGTFYLSSFALVAAVPRPKSASAK